MSMDTDEYMDIYDMPHHVSVNRKHMSMTDRGAQFAPFAALTGYEDEVVEAGRLTEQSLDIDEDVKRELDIQLRKIQSKLDEKKDVPVSIRWYKPDEYKEGGAYITSIDNVKKIDTDNKHIVLRGGMSIDVSDIISIILTKE